MPFLQKILHKRLTKIAFWERIVWVQIVLLNTNSAILTNQNNLNPPKNFFSQKLIQLNTLDIFYFPLFYKFIFHVLSKEVLSIDLFIWYWTHAAWYYKYVRKVLTILYTFLDLSFYFSRCDPCLLYTSPSPRD